MAQDDGDYFEKQIEGLPPQAQAIVALRAAMRVLPALAYRRNSNVEPFAYWESAERGRRVLAIIRCYQTSVFVNNLTKTDEDAAARAADAAYAARAAADAARPRNYAVRARPRTYDADAYAAYAADSAAAARADAYTVAIYAAVRAARAAADADAARAAGYADAAYEPVYDADYDARAADAADAARAARAAADAADRTARAAGYAAADRTARAAGYAADAADRTGGIDAAAHAAAAISRDIAQLRVTTPFRVSRELGRTDAVGNAADVLASPLWKEGTPPKVADLWPRLQRDLRSLEAGFEVWIDWYQDRLDGKPFDWEIERQWVFLSKEQLSQSPAEINAYLKALHDGAAGKELGTARELKQLKRVRAIFIGHGEVGKTSLIRALHGEDVIEGNEAMTEGVAINDAIHEQAGVFTRVTDYKDDDLTVHFWDFGGQVMAHATHQFFLRSKCLYVIVLAGRAERNPNEEAEYWLEHVRAFGDSAPVLLVGNKADQMPVALDLRTLKEKYKNIVDFHSVSCVQAKGGYRTRFAAFREELNARLVALGEHAERFTPEKFKVLKTIEEKAAKDDFISQAAFDEICVANSIAMEGAGGRDGLLDIFDKLGIVMHFARLPFLTDYVLNPRWLTYGVYAIMYSEEAQAKKGRLSETDLVAILKKAKLSLANGHVFSFPPDRCRIIMEAMIAFGVAYRLGADGFVIPALLAPEQPKHDFKPEDAISFQFDFKGFLPRHVLPALIVEQHRDIAKVNGGEIVWQNGVLLRPQRRYDAEALVRADYHTRTLDILAKGTDANLYLGMLRDCILRNLETMPLLPFEEKVQVRPEMQVGAGALGALGDKPIMMPYGAIAGAHKHGGGVVYGSDGKPYSVKKILAVMPVEAALRPADVFLSYGREDRALIEGLAKQIDDANISVWFDRELIGGQQFREVLQERIETTKAVIVLWTATSIKKDFVKAEASLAAGAKKLICLRHPDLEAKRIPLPFSANDHIITLGDMPTLMAALALKGAKPRL